jgi:Iap family predicted aminopeptidase
MAKKDMKVAPAVETLKPYLDRALNDKEFRDDLKEALAAARKLYGPLAKDALRGGVSKSASRLATDQKMQENLRKALEDFGKAAGTLKATKKKKGHKGRNAMLLAGLIAGALYNPWTGPQTREWLMDKVAGDDDLQPLDSYDIPGESSGNGASGVVSDADLAEATDLEG